MKQFGHEYMTIVNHLRIMGDALVLLNPVSPVKNDEGGLPTQDSLD
jgi:hypothetical protein